MAQVWGFLSENSLAIIGLIIGAITAIGVFLGPRLVAKRQEKKEKLRKHFDDLLVDCIKPLISVIARVSITSSSTIITDSPGPLEAVDAEQLECFETHYSKLDGWRELEGKWKQHNEKVDAFEGEIKELIQAKCAKKNISLPIIPSGANQEWINDNLPYTLSATICEKSQGSRIECDFSEAKIQEEANFYIVELCATKWARAGTTDMAKTLKSIFSVIQNSAEFAQQASELMKDAKQIKAKFEELLMNLEKIHSRALMSKDPRYKFKPIKNCPICKELFY